MIRPTTSTSQTLALGGVWLVGVVVTDVNGDAVTPDPLPAITVTGPEAQSITPTEVTADLSVRDITGRYAWAVDVGTTDSYRGRYVATVTAAGAGSVSFTAYAEKATPAAGMPTVQTIKDYLRGAAASWTDAQLTDALAAEAAAQRAVLRVPAAYPADLVHALARRVQRNLALRSVALGYATTDADADGAGALVLPGADAFVRDKEKPYRRRTVG